SNCYKPRTNHISQRFEEARDRKIGTEISRTLTPNSYFSVPIFLSDPSSSSKLMSELIGLSVVICHWSRPQPHWGNHEALFFITVFETTPFWTAPGTVCGVPAPASWVRNGCGYDPN